MLQTVHCFSHVQIHAVHREAINRMSKVAFGAQIIGQR